MNTKWIVAAALMFCVANVAGQEPAPSAAQGAASPIAAAEGSPPAAAGPAILVTGCLQAADGKGKDDAETFTLAATAPASSLSDQAAPAGVDTYRLVGLLPDLRRHVGHQVEVIGVVFETVPEDASTANSTPKALTLETQSGLATANECQKTKQLTTSN